MTLAFRVGPIAYPVGTGAFVGAFFDTIAVRLEQGARGSRFGSLAELYGSGELSSERTAGARAELATVAQELAAFAPDQLVWDFDDPAARPPWGDDIAPTITSLANYFVTSDGRQLIDVLDLALDASARVAKPLRIG